MSLKNSKGGNMRKNNILKEISELIGFKEHSETELANIIIKRI